MTETDCAFGKIVKLVPFLISVLKTIITSDKKIKTAVPTILMLCYEI